MKKIDVHTHFGPWNSIPGRRWDAASLVALMQQAEVEKAVVSSVRAVLTDLVPGNDETQAAIDQHEMLYGYIYVDPHRVSDSMAEIEKRRAHPKFLGIKSRDEYHGHRYNDAAYREIFAAARPHRLPALLHCFSFSAIQCALELAADYDAPVILTHMAGFEWRRCEGLLGQELPPNVCFDPVSSASEPGKYELALALLGEDHLVFGTDCTLLHPGLSIGAVESSELSEEVKRKLYWDNPKRIFFP